MKIDKEESRRVGHTVMRMTTAKEEPKAEAKKTQKKASREEVNEVSDEKSDFMRDSDD